MILTPTDMGARASRRRGGSPQLWTPAQLSSIISWGDCSDLSTISLNGSEVLQLDDKSGNGNHFTQSNPINRPDNAGEVINGNNTVRFNGTDSFMRAPNPFGSTINNALFFAVYKIKAITASSLFSLTGSEVPVKRWQVHGPWSDGRVYFDCGAYSGAGRVFTDMGSAVDDIVIMSFYCSVIDNKQEVRKNGTYLIGDSTGHSVSTVGDLILGANGGLPEPMNMTLCEFIICDGTVSTPEIELLEGYAAGPDRWNLQSELPSSHPYKSSPPIV